MWTASASILCGCLAVLPLFGCAEHVSTAPPAFTVAPPAVADKNAPYDSGGARVDAESPAAPAAILVFLPTMGLGGAEDSMARDPRLWAAQGFDVVMPQPADIYRMVADQQAALARLVASVRALADAPIWLVGSSPAIDAALAIAPPAGRGQVAGGVVTSVTSSRGSCSESFLYSDPGTGAPPKVEVRRTGDCGALSPSGIVRRPLITPQPTPVRPNAPRVIEASAPTGMPPAAQVRQLAELIKAPPSS